MPYTVKQGIKGCSGYAVVKETTGEIVGCHKKEKMPLII
jgi:hypothetical protein